jgi:hypothetical protein
MSTGSHAAVTSPLMSTTATASPTRLTSIVIVGPPILFLPCDMTHPFDMALPP